MLELYIIALIMIQNNPTAANIASLMDLVSHDKLTRALKRYEIQKKLLDFIAMPRHLRDGFLIIDDTVTEKPYAQNFEGASYVYSSSKGKAVYGYSTVLLIWTDGIRRIILDYRLYRKGGLSKLQIALDMLSFARNRLGVKPNFVLFDSWYAARELLKRLKDYGWKFVTRLKKNRRFSGVQLQSYRKLPRWTASGKLTGGISVRVIKDDNKYFASNCLSLSRKELLNLYSKRQHIEQVNKELKSFGLGRCQTRSYKAQVNHAGLCVIAYSMVHRRANQLKISTFECRRRLISKKEKLCISDYERLRSAA